MAICMNGHANAPDAKFCVVCGLAVAATAPVAAQDSLGLARPVPEFGTGFSAPMPAVNITMTIYGTDGCSIGLGYLDVPGSIVVLSASELKGNSWLFQATLGD